MNCSYLANGRIARLFSTCWAIVRAKLLLNLFQIVQLRVSFDFNGHHKSVILFKKIFLQS